MPTAHYNTSFKQYLKGHLHFSQEKLAAFPSHPLVKKWRWLAVSGGIYVFQHDTRFSCGTFITCNHYPPTHSPKILTVKSSSKLSASTPLKPPKSGGGWRWLAEITFFTPFSIC